MQSIRRIPTGVIIVESGAGGAHTTAHDLLHVYNEISISNPILDFNWLSQCLWWMQADVERARAFASEKVQAT